uniref:Uncharacterized protein n=1 Tax=Sphaerodactylus townsendi TaxID=933632 RepID=A0ACB8FHD7_9SAUR
MHRPMEPSRGALASFPTGAASGGGQQPEVLREASSMRPRRRRAAVKASSLCAARCRLSAAGCLGKVHAREVQKRLLLLVPLRRPARGRAACSLGRSRSLRATRPEHARWGGRHGRERPGCQPEDQIFCGYAKSPLPLDDLRSYKMEYTPHLPCSWSCYTQ